MWKVVLIQVWQEWRNFIVLLAVSMVVIGALSRFLKKAWVRLEENYAADATKLARLKVLKAWVCQILGLVLSVIFFICIAKGIPVLGGIVCAPIWITGIYLGQYVVDVILIDWIIRKREEASHKPEKPRVVKATYDENGNLVEV